MIIFVIDNYVFVGFGKPLGHMLGHVDSSFQNEKQSRRFEMLFQCFHNCSFSIHFIMVICCHCVNFKKKNILINVSQMSSFST